MRRLLTALIGLALLAGAVGVGWWAGREALVPPEDPLGGVVEPVTYTVVEGRVGRSLTFTAVAEWELVPLARTVAAGTVTSVAVVDGDMVRAGDTIMAVDLRPVVVAVGSTPMFRDLADEAEGPDVAQLQSFLAAQGFYEGEIDGVFGRVLRDAIKAWQKTVGVPDDGVVRRSDLVFIDSLPARVALSTEVNVGALLSGGEQAIWLIPDEPMFRIPLTIDQRTLVPLSSPVFVSFPDGVWAAHTVAAVEQVERGQLDLILAGADGGPVCGSDCASWLSLTDRTDFRAEVVVIPETIGTVVPVAAITTGPSGEPHVTLPDGITRMVVVVESSDGLAVVAGVTVGEVLLLPFTTTQDG